MNVIAQKDKYTGRIIFRDVNQNYAEVASIENWFSSGWLATVGSDNPATVWDMVLGDLTSARQAVYAELMRRNCEKDSDHEKDTGLAGRDSNAGCGLDGNQAPTPGK